MQQPPVVEQIEQLYYKPTFSKVGQDVGGILLRAVSHGLTGAHASRISDINRYLRYSLPENFDQLDTTSKKAPICLTFNRTNQGGKLLVNKVYTGGEKGERPGPNAYFIHMLVGLPETFTAKDAILLWRSSFWQTSADALGNSTVLSAVSLEELAQQRYASIDVSQTQAYLPFVIQAYLMRKADQRLYIAAAPDLVAALIVGLTRCVPSQFLNGLTFTTYEPVIENELNDSEQAQVTGTCWFEGKKGRQPNLDLPEACYRDHLALNCYTGRKTELADHTDASEYARFATQCLIEKQMSELRNIFKKVEVKPALLVEPFLKKAVEEAIKASIAQKNTAPIKPPSPPPPRPPDPEPELKEIITTILNDAQLATRRLKEAEVQHAILDLIIGEKKNWRHIGLDAISKLNKLSQQPANHALRKSLSAFAYRVAGEFEFGLVVGPNAENEDVARLQEILNLIICAAPSTNAPDIWQMLLRHMSANPPALDFMKTHWDIRQHLLKQWAAIAVHINTTHISPWMMVSWTDFGELLLLDLPDEWYNISLNVLLTNSPASSIPRLVVTRMRQTIVERQLQQLSNLSAAVAFATKLLEANYSSKVGLLHTFLAANHNSKQVKKEIELLLTRASLSKDEITQLLEQDGSLLLPYFPDSPTLAGYIQQFLRAFGVNDLKRPSAKKLLHDIHTHGLKLPQELLELIKSWYAIATFIDEPDLRRKTLDGLTSAMSRLSSLARTQLMEILAGIFVSHIESGLDIYSVLSAMGMALKQEEIFELLLRMSEIVGDVYKKNRLETSLVLYIQVALHIESMYTMPMQEHKKLVTQLLDKLLQFTNKETYEKLNRLAGEWPTRQQKAWQVYQTKGHTYARYDRRMIAAA